MISGVIVKPLRKISDEKGTLLKMLQSTDEEFHGFGEIYFSTVYPGIVKAWHKHQKATLSYAVVQGMIKLVLFDDREESPTKGRFEELYIGDQNYCLVQIPPRIWYGFKGIGTGTAMIADLVDIPYNPGETMRLDFLGNDKIAYAW